MDERKKKIIFISTFVVGMIVLVVGVVFLVLALTRGETVADGEYLVEKGEWKLDSGDCVMAKCSDGSGDEKCVDENGESVEMCPGDSVIWKFTEIGKGTLTTNDHVNDYDFIWAIEDGKLLIETDWLYTLENEYEYSLDQEAGVLTLKADDQEYKFVVK